MTLEVVGFQVVANSCVGDLVICLHAALVVILLP